MHIPNKKESFILLLGDILSFVASLWIALALRYGEFPSRETFLNNFTPFSIISTLWIVSFFIAGLYEKQRVSRRKSLPELILKTQLLNSVIAIIFFYFVPFFGVTPKRILFIYITVSLIFSFGWRIYALSIFGSKNKEKAMLIGRGFDALTLKKEINTNPRYAFYIDYSINTEASQEINFQKDIEERISKDNIGIIIIDSRDEKVLPILPHLYNLIFSRVQFVDLHKLYEEVFDRVPVSILQYSWFLENISRAPHTLYDFLKRAMDVIISLFLFVVFIPFYFLAIILIKTGDGGEIFSIQERMGKNNKLIKLYKFRTMTVGNDNGEWQKVENKVTKVGGFLRKSRIDELFQVWNVLKGDISLIGPRPEFAKAVTEYSKKIPYYNVRHIIKPGLSGWAQMYGEHPHHGIDVDATENKLSYDLFYIKNRSFVLDLIIALKTIKILLSREGK